MDIRKLMEEATPLPWDARHIYEEKDWDLSIAAVNALPAVLELIAAVNAWETDMHGNANEFFEQDIALVAARDALVAALNP